MKKVLLFLIASLVLISCKNKEKSIKDESSVEEQAEWISLMDASLWRGYNKNSLPGNWKIDEKQIECFGAAGGEGGDIISTQQYDNFELYLEWKISKGGNSGVFYHIIEDKIHNGPYQTAPEYQILDDVGFPEPLEDWQKTGANYAMHVANENKELKSVGQWNATTIIFNHGKVEHWLNGKKIVAFDKFTEDWQKRRNSGKWNDYPDYGKANTGYLGLQDHGGGVWFRNVKVKPLP